MIHYPAELQNIFDKLYLFGLQPIIVGGYIRDALLGIDSKDIDIELYGVDSLIEVENILYEFGAVNSVGRSFGVCKLKYKSYDLDFSLPRKDSKIEQGHKGFKVVTEKNLDFQTATSRRDFTINAIGYDVQNRLILDPFDGISDLKKKILKAVNLKTFDEDPLQVLRCVQFTSRFEFQIEENLFIKCREMIQNGMLKQLPAERIFTEFEKILLKSKKPSFGLRLLESLEAFSFFEELQSLSLQEKKSTFENLDRLALQNVEDEKEKLTLMFALLCQNFSPTQRNSFLERLTHEQKLHKNVNSLLNVSINPSQMPLSNYEIYLLATKIEIRFFLLFMKARFSEKENLFLKDLEQRAESLKVYTSALPAFIAGKDLISFGVTPSEKFSEILSVLYDAQMRELFYTKEEAMDWLKDYLLSQKDIFLVNNPD
jgi:tRNA nucleotidyltransferase (CCA-adding enzyme)